MAVARRAPRAPGAPLADAFANPYGSIAAFVGLAGAEVTSALALAIALGGKDLSSSSTSVHRDVASLLGLWFGFALAAVVAPGSQLSWRPVLARLRDAYGFAIRLVDVPIGIAVGLAGQFLLVPLLELPLYPFVPHLFTRIGQPAKSLTAGVSGGRLVLLGVFVCLGSPLFEELFFRGLLFRGMIGSARKLPALSGGAGVVLAAVVSGVVFGLVHFEPLELLALSGFGAVLALVAAKTGRLGAGFVAHVTFNTATFLALATAR